MSVFRAAWKVVRDVFRLCPGSMSAAVAIVASTVCFLVYWSTHSDVTSVLALLVWLVGTAVLISAGTIVDDIARLRRICRRTRTKEKRCNPD